MNRKMNDPSDNFRSDNRISRIASIFVKVAIVGGVGLVLLLMLLVFVKPHFYFLKQVSPEQVGVKIRGGSISEIVPPGVYSDVGLFVKLETYSTAEYRFSVSDPEVITRDQQRIGVTVSGSAFRPDSLDQERVKGLWTQYRSVFLSDESLQKVMNDLAMQAMKVCVGDKPFQESVIGSDRDALRSCIDTELTDLIQPYGLKVANVVVPNVALSAEVQAKMDAITQSRLDTEKAQQDEQKALAQGKAQQAEQEAAIRVEQSKKQEQARQETTLAQIEENKLKAQQAVIQAQKANDLLSAQKNVEIAKTNALSAQEQAKADLAQQTALAALYAQHPEYMQLMVAQANASAIKPTDKVILAPEGSFPYIVLGNNVLPTISLPTTSGPPAPEAITP